MFLYHYYEQQILFYIYYSKLKIAEKILKSKSNAFKAAFYRNITNTSFSNIFVIQDPIFTMTQYCIFTNSTQSITVYF